MNYLKLLFKQPLFHFSVIAAVLFGLYREPVGPLITTESDIVVRPGQVTRLKENFSKTWRREPTSDELSALIDDLVREEVYYREALAMGLDLNDKVIRLRLRQKMEFLAGSDIFLPDIERSELIDFFKSNIEDYRTPEKIAFTQLFLGKTATLETIESVTVLLRSFPDKNIVDLAQTSLLPESMTLSSSEVIGNIYGKLFSNELRGGVLGSWSGPVMSTYGVHLVFIENRIESRLPSFEEVEEYVFKDYQSSRQVLSSEKFYERLRKRYRVVLPEDE